jgi:alkylhydroperoxidase/carboxymuconolactone decarboxylase family protein YurZ
MTTYDKELQEALDHFMGTLGNIPEPIRAMRDYAPEALVGYTRTRKYLMRRPPEGALDMRTKELVYVLLDVVTGNLSGAKNHLHAAMREGLTVAQLAEALMQTMAVCGITTWGQSGWRLCDYAAQIERGEAVNEAGEQGLPALMAKTGNPSKTAKHEKTTKAKAGKSKGKGSAE